MSNPSDITIPAIEITAWAADQWSIPSFGRVALLAGAVGLICGASPEVDTHAIAEVLPSIGPARWMTTDNVHVWTVKDSVGRAFAVLHMSVGFLVGLPAEVGIAISTRARIAIIDTLTGPAARVH